MTSRSILITGCSSGIGFDAACTLRENGWRVFATCRQQADCERLKQLGFESFVIDYANSATLSSAVATVLECTGGTVDALFNNGAYAIPGLVEDLPRDALRAIFENNVFGQFELINLLLPTMRKQVRAHIVNCSSVLGFAALPFRGAYNATKFAMEGLTDTLRLELRHSSIKVVLIEPGPISTKIRQNSRTHFEKWIDVDSSAQKKKYKSQLMPRLYQQNTTPDRFELPPSAVTARLVKALDTADPNPRYFVTKPTYIAACFKRLTTSRAFDRLIASR